MSDKNINGNTIKISISDKDGKEINKTVFLKYIDEDNVIKGIAELQRVIIQELYHI